MKAMKEAAKTDKKIADRVKLFLYRVPEELYDFKDDPDAKNNIADNPKHKKQLTKMRKEMLTWMIDTKDHLESEFRKYLKG